MKTSTGQQREGSSQSRPSPCDAPSRVTEELGQRAAAVARRVCLDEEVGGDRRGTRKEETEGFSPMNSDTFCHCNKVNTHKEKLDTRTTADGEPSATRGVRPALESHPRVELPKLVTGGDESAPDGSEPFKPVWSTPAGPPSGAVVVTEASGDRPAPHVDSNLQGGDEDGEEVCNAMTAPIRGSKQRPTASAAYVPLTLSKSGARGQQPEQQVGADAPRQPSSVLTGRPSRKRILSG